MSQFFTSWAIFLDLVLKLDMQNVFHRPKYSKSSHNYLSTTLLLTNLTGIVSIDIDESRPTS